MSYAEPAFDDLQRGIRNALLAHWRLFLAQGVIVIILGVLAVIWPVPATLAVDIYCGWLLLLSGLIGLVAMLWSNSVPAFVWTLLTAALSLAVGVLLLWQPAAGAVSLTLVLTAFFIAEGVFQIATSVAYRHAIFGTWGWMLASGFADMVLATIILEGFPDTAGWVVGVLVGVNLITSELALIMVSLASRSGLARPVNAA